MYSTTDTIVQPIHYTEPNDTISFTVKTIAHNSFCFDIKSAFNYGLSQLVHSRGPNTAKKIAKRKFSDLSEFLSST